MRYNYLKNSIVPAILVFIFLVAPSCQKKKEDPEPQQSTPGAISSEKTSFKGYEIGILYVANYNLTESQYDITFGGKKVTGAKNKDNSLTYIVPGDLPTGSYEVKTSFTENTLTLNVTAPEVIVNPVTYVGDLIGNPDDDIANYIDFSKTSTVPADLTTAKNNLNQAYSNFQALSVADQQRVAQFLKANEEFFTEAKALIQDLKTIQPDIQARLAAGGILDCTTKTCKVITSIAKVAGVLLLVKSAPIWAIGAAIVVGADIALSIITNKTSFTVSVIFAFLEEAFKLAYWAPNYAINITLDAADAEITKGLRVAAGTMQILKTEPFTVKPKIEFSSFSNTLNTNNSVIKAAISALEKAKGFYINTLDSPAGPFPTYKNLKETKKPETLSQVSMKVLNNNNVTVSAPVGTVDEFQVTFNTSATTDQDFTLEITYTGEYETSVKTYPSRLLLQRPPSKAEAYSGNLQTGPLNSMLTDPLRVKITDATGAPLKGVTVSWLVLAGAGSVTAGTSLTDDLGIAETRWTLGASGNQKVSAVVSRADGKPVTGIPVIFTANNSNNYMELLTNNSSKSWKQDGFKDMGCGQDVIPGCNFWDDDRVIFSANGTVTFNNGPAVDCSSNSNFTCVGPSGSSTFNWEFSSDFSKLVIIDGTDRYEYVIVTLTSTNMSLNGGTVESYTAQ